MLDPNIAMGFQGLGLADPMEQRAKAASLAHMGMQQQYMQSKMDEQNRVNTLGQMRGQAYMQSGGDAAKLREMLAANGDYEGVMSHDKSQSDARKSQTEMGDKIIGLRAKAAQFAYTGGTIQHAQQAAQLLAQSGDTEGAQHIMQAVQANPDATPDQVRQFFQPHLALGQKPEDLLNPRLQDTGGQLIDMNPYTKQAPINKTQSPESVASNQVTREGHQIQREGQAKVDARAREANGISKAPVGYRFKPGGSLEAISGGPADVKNAINTEANRIKTEAAEGKARIVNDKVDEALSQVGFTTSGLTGKTMSMVPGTGAYDLDKTVETIKANLGFKELADMRAASPTGGALGQVAVKELEFLQAAVSSLDVGQSEAQLRKNLLTVKRHYGNWKNTVAKAGKESANIDSLLEKYK